MAINSPVLDMVAKVAAKLPAPRRMLCLGYPDMLVTRGQIAVLCGEGGELRKVPLDAIKR